MRRFCRNWNWKSFKAWNRKENKNEGVSAFFKLMYKF
jgi:hypothetical protein